jgi:galactose mutarotase-like enzyme
MEPATVILENAQLRVELLPARGARLVSLLDRRTGREWLLPRQGPSGADFAADPSGFDECFPNVAPGPCPGGEFSWPDHGELWNRPWDVRREGEALVCRIQGRARPYTLTRRLALDGDTLCLNYELENLGAEPFPHLWSAHPLLQARPGMRIELPAGVDEVLVDWASDPALGLPGQRRPWPGSPLDLGLVSGSAAGIAAKLFVQALSEGSCALRDPATGHALRFSWDPAEIPHLGVWLCYGGWPSAAQGHLTVALEPCTGMPDALDAAWRLGCARVLPAGERSRWSFRLRSCLERARE